MKKLALVIISGLCLQGCSFVPPGTTELKDNRAETLYMDKTPLTNLAWKEYLYWLKDNHGKQSTSYRNALPDTAVWTKAYPDSGYLANAYNNKPVVGISLAQAKAYCEWRSRVVSQKFDRTVTYQLPDYQALKKVPELEKFAFNKDLKELTANGKMTNWGQAAQSDTYKGSTPDLGFRCIATCKTQNP